MPHWLNRIRYSPYALYIPVVLLCAVAINQLYLVRAHGLPPWKGGGFGMFATIDRSSDRFLRVYLLDESDNKLPVNIPAGYERECFRLETLPNQARLNAFAATLAQRPWKTDAPERVSEGDDDEAAPHAAVARVDEADVPAHIEESSPWNRLHIELWTWEMSGEPLRMQPRLRMSATAPLSAEADARDE